MDLQGHANSQKAGGLCKAIVASLALVAAAIAPRLAQAGVSSDLESLGGNKAVDARAARLSSTNQSAVVQGRIVDRNNRLELGGTYGAVGGGNSYLFTQAAGAMAEYHFVPQFSLGVRYEQAFNSLTNEGKAAFDNAKARQAQDKSYTTPDIDYPDHSLMGTATWYMFYGKLNFFDLRVVQFDVYTIGGYGQMTTSRTTSPTYTAGGGIAFWVAQHVTSRFELRYQGYKDKPYTGERDLNMIIASFGLGVLL